MDTPAFTDGLGRRTPGTDPGGDAIESLRLCRELSEADTTEAALIQRAARLSSFDHPSFTKLRRVERVRGALGGLVVVSTAVEGTRLSEILRRAQDRWVEPDLDAAFCLVREIVVATAALHRHGRDLGHGAIGPERVVVRPDGRPVLAEHGLGPAIEALQMGRTALWTRFRIPVPPTAGTARFDQATDVVELAVLALALILGRPILRDEFPQRLPDLLEEVSSPPSLSGRPALPRAIRSWLARAFQFQPRSSFRTAVEAAAALDEALAEERRPRSSRAAVLRYLAAVGTPDRPGDPGRAAGSPGAGAHALVGEPAAECVISADAGAGDQLTLRVFEALPAPGGAGPDAGSIRSEAPADELPGAGAGAAAARVAPVPVRTAPRAPRRPAARWTGLVRRAVREAASVVSRAATHRFSMGDWLLVRRAVPAVVVTCGLTGLFGATYLGARDYFDLPALASQKGTLVVESRPGGVPLLVDGLPAGRTPATLALDAGQHTLTLQTPKGTMLVPVTVVAGERRIERVVLRGQRHLARPAAAIAAAPLRPSR